MPPSIENPDDDDNGDDGSGSDNYYYSDEDDDVENIDFNNDGDDEDYADACMKLI